MTKTRLVSLLICALCVVSELPLRGQDRTIRTARRPIANQYIVVLASQDDADAVGLETQSLYRGRLRHVYRQALRGFSIRLDRASARALARDPRVLFVEEDSIAESSDVQSAPPSWGLDRIDQRVLPLDARYSFPPAATTVHVHVVDTGVRFSHLEFGGRAFNAGDFIDDDGDGDPGDVGNDDGNPAVPDGTDCHGHGTHVAATIAGSSFGVAKHAVVHSYRALDCAGRGPVSGLLAAIDAITADGRRPAVVNLSLGGDPSPALDDAVRRSIAAGITYAIAAGNGSVDAGGQSPGRVSEAITVGATDAGDQRAGFSNFGPAVDIFAPGVAITSAWTGSNSATAAASGTSMATPHVAGVAALYLEQFGNRTPLEVRTAIVAAASVGLVWNPGTGSPNALLYSSFALPAGAARTNVAASSQGAHATGSTSFSAGYPAAAVINGDRRGTGPGAGGYWNDATPGLFPDWVEITFSGPRVIDEVDVFSVQDSYAAPLEPTTAMIFSLYGLADFTVQFWSGSAWQAIPGGVVRGNSLVWRTVTFPPLITSRIRVLVEQGQDHWSRVTEVEAYAAAATPGNVSPVISLNSPADGTSLIAPATITLAATATDTDGSVANVTFLANGVALGEDSVAPYSLSWTVVLAGVYSVGAVVTDNAGATATAAPITLLVTSSGGARTNVALASQGAAAVASSSYSTGYPPGAIIDGDRRGAPAGAGGYWNDGTAGVFPDWIEVAFSGPKTIDEVAVFSVQDTYWAPIDPGPTTQATLYGLADFTIQYWTGTAWDTVPGGSVRGNSLVWRTVGFPALTTTGIRVLSDRSQDHWSRITEVEVYEASGGTPPLSGTEWFVTQGASGDGSSGNPFGRIQDALNVARAGDFVTVRPGTYAERLSTVRSGTAGLPITLRSAAGRASVLVTNSGRVLTVGHEYIVVDGLTLDGQYGVDDLVRVGSSSHFLQLKNSEFRRSSRDAIDIGAPNGVLVQGCLIHHALNPADGRSDAHGIVAGAVHGLTIRDSEIHTFSGDGIQVDAGRSAPGWSGLTIERTHIWLQPLPAAENGFPAGVAPGENAVDTKASASYPRATVVLRDVVASGFRDGLITNMAAFNLKEHVAVTVDAVTVFESEIAFRLRGATTGGAWVTIKNAVVSDVFTAFRYEDNIQNLHIWNSTVGANVTQAFQAASSVSTGLEVRNLLVFGFLPAQAAHSSNLAVDASAFVSVAERDYRLAAFSPAVDRALPLAEVGTDRLGVTRPQGTAPDVGAFERP
jgi:hypothetical protein